MLAQRATDQRARNVGKLFGQRLRAHREARQISGNKLAGLTETHAPDKAISQANLNSIELGKRPPSDANIEALAAVPALELTSEEMKAWRTLDEIGEDGLDRIKRYVPEALTNEAMPGRGGTYPPTDEEIAVIKRAQAQGWTPGAVKTPDLWALPPERRRDVFDRIKGLIEVQDRITQEGQDAG